MWRGCGCRGRLSCRNGGGAGRLPGPLSGAGVTTGAGGPQWRGSREAPRARVAEQEVTAHRRAAMEGEPGGSPGGSGCGSQCSGTPPQWRGSREAPRARGNCHQVGLRLGLPQWRGSREAPRAAPNRTIRPQASVPQWRGSREAPRASKARPPPTRDPTPPQWRGSREAPRAARDALEPTVQDLAAMEGEPGGSPGSSHR